MNIRRAPSDDENVSQADAEPASTRGRKLARLAPTARPDHRMFAARDALDPRWEKVRALRTELLLRRGTAGRADLLALTSPCPREGRSLLAAELAIAFAQTGRPTLLVDADLRNPRQHLLFGVENTSGLSQSLEFGVAPQIDSVLGRPGLSLLKAGAIPLNPLELLSSDALASMIEGWRRDFAFVVFDTPPVKRYADALIVANLAGRVLTLTRAQHTPYREMRDMLRRLAITRCEVLGTVISHF